MPVQELIRFGRRVNRLDAAEAGFKEMVRRKKEAQTAEPLVKYGDFLADEKKDPLAAIDEYRQALIWKPEDDATRSKVAEIMLAAIGAVTLRMIREAAFRHVATVAKAWWDEAAAPQPQPSA